MSGFFFFFDIYDSTRTSFCKVKRAVRNPLHTYGRLKNIISIIVSTGGGQKNQQIYFYEIAAQKTSIRYILAYTLEISTMLRTPESI